MTLIDLRTKSL